MTIFEHVLGWRPDALTDSEPGEAVVYVLFDWPVDDPQPHVYVGIASRGFRRTRFKDHLRGAQNGDHSYRSNWLRTLDHEPAGYIIDYAPSRKAAGRLEKFWRWDLERRGFKVTNETAGGEGCTELSPDAKARMITGIREALNRPDVKARMREAWNRPGAKARRCAAIREVVIAYFANPANREKHSRATSLRFSDPIERAKTAAATREVLRLRPDLKRACVAALHSPASRAKSLASCRRPAVRQQMSDARRKRFAEDPDYKRRVLAALDRGRETYRRKRSADPNYGKASEATKARMSESQRKRFAEDPDYRARIEAALARGRATMSSQTKRARRETGLVGRTYRP